MHWRAASADAAEVDGPAVAADEEAEAAAGAGGTPRAARDVALWTAAVASRGA